MKNALSPETPQPPCIPGTWPDKAGFFRINQIAWKVCPYFSEWDICVKSFHRFNRTSLQLTLPFIFKVAPLQIHSQTGFPRMCGSHVPTVLLFPLPGTPLHPPPSGQLGLGVRTSQTSFSSRKSSWTFSGCFAPSPGCTRRFSAAFP